MGHIQVYATYQVPLCLHNRKLKPYMNGNKWLPVGTHDDLALNHTIFINAKGPRFCLHAMKLNPCQS